MITVLGSINMDLIATTERLPQPGETVAGSSLRRPPAARAPTRHSRRAVPEASYI